MEQKGTRKEKGREEGAGWGRGREGGKRWRGKWKEGMGGIVIKLLIIESIGIFV